MSDTEQKAETVVRPRHCVGRLTGAIVLFSVVALFAALTLWAVRPRWYTFASKPGKAALAVSLVVRVPIGWVCQEEDDTTDCTVINIRPKPPFGLARLWQEYVLCEHRTQDSNEQRSIDLIYSAQTPRSSSDSEYFRFLVAGSLESDLAVTSRTFEHPLGPAVERIHGRQEVVHDEVMRIVVRAHPPGTRIEVIASRSGPSVELNRTRVQWDQIVRSIRVVQK